MNFNTNEWHSEYLEVQIPEATLIQAENVARFMQSSRSSKVGDFNAWLRLIVEDGDARAFVAAKEPSNSLLPYISGLEITIVNDGDTLGRVTVDGEQKMRKDGGATDSWSIGGDIQCCDNEETATIDELVDWCDNGKLTMRAQFQLKGEKALVVGTNPPAFAIQDEDFWESVTEY